MSNRFRFLSRLSKTPQSGNFSCCHLDIFSKGEPWWQSNRAKSHPHQSTDCQINGLEQTANLPVSTLIKNNVIPMIRSTTSTGFNALEPRQTVGQFDPLTQTMDLFFGKVAAHPHRILPFDSARGMHQQIRQLSRRRKHQQSAGVEIQATDCDPSRRLQGGEPVKHAGSPLRVIPRNDLTRRFVIQKDPDFLLAVIECDQLAIHNDPVR